MRYLNIILNRVHEVLLGWLGFLSPFWSLFIVSAVTGVVLLIIFRYTSNQKAIRRVRDKITAELLAAKLFKDDIRVTLRAQGQLFVQSGRLLVCMIRPLAIMIVPMALFFVQLSLWYEYRPLLPGESAIVSLELANAADLRNVTAPPQPSEGLRVVTPALRLRNSARIEWAVAGDAEGLYELHVRVGDQDLTIPVVVSEKPQRISWRIPTTGIWDQFLHPDLPPLPKTGPIIGVDVRYPVRSTELLGVDIHWIITLIILSTIFALIFKPILKVNL